LNTVKKKYLGQHFLHEKTIAEKVAKSLLQAGTSYTTLLEIGPGDGSLSQYLSALNLDLHLIEIDQDLIDHLKSKFESNNVHIHHADFLSIDLKKFNSQELGIIGNYPYNISSQILIKVVQNRHLIPEMAGMFQKEVAERVTAGPGSKTYGRLSVMVNAYFDTEYLFTVSKGAFNPPPKVESAVIRLSRKSNYHLDCNEKLFSRIVAAAFQQRRKTLRNALKPHLPPQLISGSSMLQQRAEQLSISDFVEICSLIEKYQES
jgi:16S rRNA (adenine1518-N6/adenine1519-N6)-dimethyltransferase